MIQECVPGPPLRFPMFDIQELLGLVIECLADDRDCLQACTKVAQSWHSRARQHLFHKLAISLRSSGVDQF